MKTEMMLASEAVDAGVSQQRFLSISVFRWLMSKLLQMLRGLTARTALIIGVVLTVAPSIALAGEPTIGLTADEKAWLEEHRVVRVMVQAA